MSLRFWTTTWLSVITIWLKDRRRSRNSAIEIAKTTIFLAISNAASFSKLWHFYENISGFSPFPEMLNYLSYDNLISWCILWKDRQKDCRSSCLDRDRDRRSFLNDNRDRDCYFHKRSGSRSQFWRSG